MAVRPLKLVEEGYHHETHACITGWPDVGELAMAKFLDTAIDAAIAAAKEMK